MQTVGSDEMTHYDLNIQCLLSEYTEFAMSALMEFAASRV